MKHLTKVGVFQLSIASAVSAIAIAGAAPAHAVTFVSTFRPSGDITVPGNGVIPLNGEQPRTEVGSVNTATGAYTRFGTYDLQLTDIAVNNAGTIYGSTYDQLYILGSGNTATIVGNTSNVANFGFNGLAFDSNNNLFGLAGVSPRAGSTGTPGFYSINTATGAANLISNLGGTNFGGPSAGLAPTAFGFQGTTSIGDTSDLAFAGNIAGINTFFAVTGNDNAQLFTITTGGVATKIGTGTGYSGIAGLAYENGVLRGYDTSRRQIVIDTATGLGSLSPLTLTGIPAYPNGTNPLLGGAASTPTAVPEPFTIVGTMIGAASAWKMRKRLKATNKM